MFVRRFIFALALVIATLEVANAQVSSPERTAQQLLLDYGYDIGTVDGVWGDRSRAAMTDLQQKLGLPPTGLPDAATLEVLSLQETPGGEQQPAQPVETATEAPSPPAPPANETDAPPAELEPSVVEGAQSPGLVIEGELPPAGSNAVGAGLPKPAPAAPQNFDVQTPPAQPAPVVRRLARDPFTLGFGITTGLCAIGVFAYYTARKRRRQTFQQPVITARTRNRPRPRSPTMESDSAPPDQDVQSGRSFVPAGDEDGVASRRPG